ncbi:MAG: exodeoxyribonuclease III [Candidatus Woesearchaeota archaeon]
MKILSWNVNGLRAVMKKNFNSVIEDIKPDIVALQEIKMKKEQINQIEGFDFENYYKYWNSAEKPGYSGTLVMTKEKPLGVDFGIGEMYLDEGRIITLEYQDFYLVNVYTPNSQRGLKRLDYRMEFEKNFKQYLKNLDTKKPVILCGDLNVAHKEIDLKNPKTNTKNPGFTIQEREKFGQLLEDNDFLDTFRYFYPDTIKYSWWSYMFNARKNNAGWRIDYFVTSKRMVNQIQDSQILDTIKGSDHCPILLDLK